MKAQHIPAPDCARHLAQIKALAIIGNPALLDAAQLALFCSVECPASIILKFYDLAQQLKNKGVGVISGFHSPVEKEALVTLLRGDAPVIVCPARSIANMRVPSDWKSPIESGRLLIISPFPENQNRPTQQSATLRNRFIATCAEQVFIAYARPGGKTERFARELLADGRRILTFQDEQTKNLLASGAKTLKL